LSASSNAGAADGEGDGAGVGTRTATSRGNSAAVTGCGAGAGSAVGAGNTSTAELFVRKSGRDTDGSRAGTTAAGALSASSPMIRDDSVERVTSVVSCEVLKRAVRSSSSPPTALPAPKRTPELLAIADLRTSSCVSPPESALQSTSRSMTSVWI
jgi:hypothetical protein